MDRTELAWAAGFWDGEGSAWSSQPLGRGTAQPRARINQASSSGIPQVLSRFQQAVGCGSIKGPELKEGREPLYRWLVSSRPEVRKVYDALGPWLGSVKVGQLDAALQRPAERVVTQWARLPEEERCAWAAGLWDGEGSICLLKHRSHVGHFVPEASVTQSSAEGRPEVLVRISLVAAPGYWYGPFTQAGSPLPVYRWKLFRRDEIEVLIGRMWQWLGDVKRDQVSKVIAVLDGQTPLPRGNPAWGTHKTHCVKGHEYASARIRPYKPRKPGGMQRRDSKQCLECVRDYARRKRARDKMKGPQV